MPLYETIQDFPAGICITDAVLRATHMVGEQVNPFTFGREVQVFPGARWEIELTFLPMERCQAQKLEAWLLSLRGKAGRFRMGDPFRSLPLGTALGAPLVTAAAAGAETFTSHGWASRQAQAMQAGDFIQLGNRLHMVLQDVATDATGNASLTVWPPLRENHAAATPIITRNARGVFAYADNGREFARDRLQYNTTTLRAVEVI